MGWEVAEGPEVEHEWFNFDALNFGGDHPAASCRTRCSSRRPAAAWCCATHTSPVQVRSLLDRELPVYVVCPGRVFRADALDATHSPVFAQVEGLCVDEGITMATCAGRWTTSPPRCSARASARACAQLLPVHRAVRRGGPAVLQLPGRLDRAGRRAVPRLLERGLDRVGRLRHGQPRRAARLRGRPRALHGFAFGMGLDRTLMFRHGITDIRDFYEGDQRFSLALGTEA
jgi:phenylalanyl-tRNA synthetase alpha chain